MGNGPSKAHRNLGSCLVILRKHLFHPKPRVSLEDLSCLWLALAQCTYLFSLWPCGLIRDMAHGHVTPHADCRRERETDCSWKQMLSWPDAGLYWTLTWSTNSGLQPSSWPYWSQDWTSSMVRWVKMGHWDSGGNPFNYAASISHTIEPHPPVWVSGNYLPLETARTPLPLITMVPMKFDWNGCIPIIFEYSEIMNGWHPMEKWRHWQSLYSAVWLRER